ncbi:ribosomal protein S3 [Neorickettsia helminthoeca str. Oregon]|uniref:Small ribosomal subunit protein uS3 n=1 Tax=Neorickettsia helminthoeca str. Oregon TaxID=1286528 RepID=X5H3S7_9RICK|nr:30S ribosomal protein S3 [Neorickettsia helminthoeca]AHX11216.1 ribosomal protein S3 [Neorickettsia helminthoeca str. Oregon]
MGQKVNPVGFRLCVHDLHDSVWYAKSSDYAKTVAEDCAITRYFSTEFAHVGVSRVLIKRKGSVCDVTLHCAKPGLMIGKKGADLEILKSKLAKKFGFVPNLNVVEVKKPNSSAVLIAKNIAFQLEKRSSFRRVIKKAIATVMRESDVRGIKVACSGRLSGAEIARTEVFKEGSVPLHTLRADIDYWIAEANTSYGVIGVKVWIYRGDVFRV